MKISFYFPHLLSILLVLMISGCGNSNPTTIDNGNGTIILNPLPSSIGASWVLVGPNEFTINGNTRFTVSDLVPGSYSVSWNEVESYQIQTSNPQTAPLKAGQTLTFNCQYVEIPSEPNNLIVLSGEIFRMVTGSYVFDEVQIDGVVMLSNGPVEIDADTFVISSTGKMSGKILSDNNTSSSFGISIRANSITVDGILESPGVFFSLPEMMGGGTVARNGGDISIETDALIISGLIKVDGGSGFCHFDDIQMYEWPTRGTSAGSIAIHYTSDMVASGSLSARGGDGENSCQETPCTAANAGSGGLITVSPAGSFPDLSFNIQAGNPGQGLYGCNDGASGVDGFMTGILSLPIQLN